MATVADHTFTLGKVALTGALRRAVGEAWVMDDPDSLSIYAYDGSVERGLPDVVVFPKDTTEVQAVVRIAHNLGVPVVGRGAGTGLSGGAIATCGGVMVSTSRMNRILEVDYRNMRAVVEAGVVNADLSAHTAHYGFQYAPDPSSQKACTIGGNIATNAGGPHTLAYGVTANHVLGVEFVTCDGHVVNAGGAALDLPGYDLAGLFCGSEGTFGVVTRATLRLVRKPAGVCTMLASFAEVAQSSASVSGIVAAGIVPAAMEMMDQISLEAIAQFVPEANLPTNLPAVLLVELEGVPEELESQEEAVRAVFARQQAREVRVAADKHERDLLWLGRKSAFGAMGRISRNYYVQDGVIPRTTITEVLAEIAQVSEFFGIPIANVFHAGDGNLHPLLLFDDREAGVLDRVIECGTSVLKVCVDVGGMLSGEHGIGMEKHQSMGLVFSDADLERMQDVRGVFNPRNLFNPGKVFPAAVSCAEVNNLRRAKTVAA
jgi:glycolate oxidase